MLPVFYAGQVRMHRTISAMLGCIVVVLLAASTRHGNTSQCLVYLAAVAISVVECLPEEFFRFAWQTRIGAWMKNPAAGWLIASMAWAVLHGPVDYSQSHSTVEAMLSVIDIVPLGLLWGYLSHRTGSFLPSVLLHGLNFWGLQNLDSRVL
jgi:membrane protease YdiL (CAAX protease family)